MSGTYDRDDTDDSEIDRRAYLEALGALGVVGAGGLAGCTGGGGDGETTEPSGGSDGDGDGGTQQTQYKELEMIHWWTAGSEKSALDALKEVFKEEYPQVSIKNNPAPGGAGSAFDSKIKSRILNENPPSTFQIWPGKALTPYTEANALRTIDDVWTDDMEENYLQGVKDAAKFDGEYKAVPVNIHRLNNLFYNANVLSDAGVDPSSLSSVTDVVDAMAAVEENTDAVGMAQAQAVWTTLQMWETILIANSGPDTFMSIIDGGASDNESAIRDSLQQVVDTREYWNGDAASITWDQGAAKVINGDAAFIHQGDWAAGEFLGAEDFEYGSDWDNVAFPGSGGVYSLVMDSFVFPEPNPSPNSTTAWLETCGSAEGQKAFNQEKGSIPPRKDVSSDAFGPFLTQQMEDFSNSDSQPPTIAHGAAVSPTKKSEIEGAFSAFIENFNVDSTTNKVVNILG